MGLFQKIGSIFKKGSSKVGSLFKKGAVEVGSAFRKAGGAIGQGLGSLGGGALGSSLGEGLALAIAPEFTIPAMAVGAVVGSKVVGELGKRTGTALTRDRKPAVIMHNTIHRSPIPDGRFFKQPPRLGEGGAGQRVPIKNMLERSKPTPKPEIRIA
jgi:hypothetical protein